MAELQRPRDFLKVMWGAQFVSSYRSSYPLEIVWFLASYWNFRKFDCGFWDAANIPMQFIYAVYMIYGSYVYFFQGQYSNQVSEILIHQLEEKKKKKKK